MWIKWHSGKLVLTLTWTRTWSRPGLGPDHGAPWLLQTDWVITRTTRPYLESVLTALQRNPLSVTGPESDLGLTMTQTSNGLALHHRFSPEVPVMEENVERQVFFRWWRPDVRQWSCLQDKPRLRPLCWCRRGRLLPSGGWCHRYRPTPSCCAAHSTDRSSSCTATDNI